MQHSTSDHGRRSTVKLIRDKTWKTNDTSNIVYFLYQGKGFGSKSFFGWETSRSLLNLSKMSINILSPNGTKLKNLEDVFKLDTNKSITQTNSSLVIPLLINITPYFHIGNSIRLKVNTESSDFNLYC
jgi:hypothetical protein